MRALRLAPLLAAALVAAGAAHSATRPAPTGTIVFASDRAGAYQLYSVRADGSRLGQLTLEGLDADELAPAPAFSPDGARIAFERGYSDLWTMNADGSGQRKLAGPFAFTPAWSPDSRHIAYTELSNPSPLLVIAATGGRPRQVLGGDNDHESWSPDGKRLAVFHAADRDSPDQLSVVGAGGTGLRVLVPGPGSLALWSPNGTSVATLREIEPAGGITTNDLVVALADGSGLRTVATDVESEPAPAWSPAGNRLAYAVYDSAARQLRLLVAADGTKPRLVAPDVDGFAWSPAGALAYIGPHGHLLVVPAAGGGAARDVTPRGAGSLSSPVWSPDGRWLLVTDRAGGLRVVAADGSSARRVALGDTYPYVRDNGNASWRPRGSTPARLGGRPAPLPAPADLATKTLLRTSGPILSLEAAGGRVAAYVDWAKQDCDHATVWRPGTQPRHIGFQELCQTPLGRNDRFISTLGFDGQRVGWAQTSPSPSTSYSDMYTASTARPAVVGAVDLHADSFEDGIGDVHGGGGLLVFDTWSACPDPDGGYECGPGAGDPLHDPTLTDQALWKVSGGTSVPLRHGRGAMQVLDVGGGRIVTLEPGGALDVLRSDGALVRRFAVNALLAALGDRRLAILDGPTLEIRDAVTGQLLHRFRVDGEGATSLDLSGGLAVWTDGAVHVVRLADGRRTSFAVSGVGGVFAQLQPDGLFIGYSVGGGARRGRIDFVPHAQLERRLDR